MTLALIVATQSDRNVQPASEKNLTLRSFASTNRSTICTATRHGLVARLHDPRQHHSHSDRLDPGTLIDARLVPRGLVTPAQIVGTSAFGTPPTLSALTWAPSNPAASAQRASAT
jgi:hypothetical protein